MLPAVERFGWSRISRNSTPGNRKAGIRPRKKRVTSWFFRLSSRARCRMEAYFASSDGWKLTGPTRSQRREPFSIRPIPGMATRISRAMLNSSSVVLIWGFASVW